MDTGVCKPGESGLLEQAEGTASAKPSWCEKGQGVLATSPSLGWVGGGFKVAQQHLGLKVEVRELGLLT